ncbi:B-cell receptor-associated protein and related proteins [Phaffia rhodozyma]|uniref:Endoplasmic reticulum transmembrane protein n=1 Tax=Phaffia rhodozyma TaxID=264483 RepID=A0A0F7SX87_PHARH|nr:B-cell receptor-associated protein and related proteins [Phaffia rhodozyma]
MALYYSLCFLLLAGEIALGVVMLGPWPHAMRRQILTFLNVNPIVAKIQYALKIAFIFVTLLFIDAVQRLVRVASKDQANQAGGTTDLRSEEAIHSRKFYAQRNMYLTGGTLGLALLLARAFSIALELIDTTEELGRLKKGAAAGSRTKGEIEQLEKQVVELEGALARKDQDLATLKSQASNQATEFDRQGAVGVGAGVGSDKRVD